VRDCVLRVSKDRRKDRRRASNPAPFRRSPFKKHFLLTTVAALSLSLSLPVAIAIRPLDLTESLRKFADHRRRSFSGCLREESPRILDSDFLPRSARLHRGCRVINCRGDRSFCHSVSLKAQSARRIVRSFSERRCMASIASGPFSLRRRYAANGNGVSSTRPFDCARYY